MQKQKLLLLFTLLLFAGSAFAQTCYNVVGYYPSWVAGGNYYINSPSKIDYSKYTHICYAFVIPGTDGNIGAVGGAAALTDLVTRGHAAGVKVLLSVGGWLDSSPSSTPFEAISTNTASINRLADACARLVTQYNLDGIDLDWEYPTTKARWNALAPVIANRMHGMGKLFTAAVAESAFYGDNYDNVGIVDLLNIMCYGPYTMARDAMQYWTNRGVPQNKRMLGVPFYDQHNTTAEHVQKSNLAKTTAAGIMIWDIASEYGDINSIYNTLGNVCNNATPVPSNLALNKTVTASSTEDPQYAASYAVDASYGTRWSSTFSDDQWIYVDLGGPYSINRVKITWEAAYATAYQIQVSDNPAANDWKQVKAITGNNTVVNDHTGLSATGRYVRIAASARATAYGYSIYAIEVYGTQADNQAPTAPANLRSTAVAASSASLAWNASTDNVAVTGYDVFKDGVLATTTTGTTYTATSLAENTTYTFTVKAKDAAGNSSAASNSVSVVTQVNLARNKPVTVSSEETADYVKAYAVDGNLTTRWSTLFADPQWIYIDLGARYDLNRVRTVWETAFAKAFEIQVSDNPAANDWKQLYSTTTATGGMNDITVTGTGRYVRIYATQRNTVYGYSLWEVEIYGTPASEEQLVNLALNKTAVASSLEDATFPANLAIDGNVATRWASLEGIDPQFITVDLGATYDIRRVKLVWENAYAKNYTLEASADGNAWSEVYTTTTGDGATDDIAFTPVATRYVRLNGTARGTTFGYSLYEFEVYGTTQAARMALSVYPNPARETIGVSIQGAVGQVNIKIVNTATGQVSHTSAVTKEGTTQIGVSGWQKGIYLIQLKTEKETLQQRLVIE
jgi:GH18 family chitinase/chitodextrinase